MERNGDKEPISGLMTLSTSVIGSIIILKGKVNTDGPTAEFTMDNGKKISYMEKVFIIGQTEENMKESI